MPLPITPPTDESGMTKPDDAWELWFDGTAAPNPGRVGIGALIVSPAGDHHEISTAPGKHGCSNEAELLALAAALEFAQCKGAARLCIHGDSRFVVDCLNGCDSTEIQRLAMLIDQLRMRLAGFAAWELRWLPRHRNKTADRLARAALGLAEKLPKKRKRRK
ncbi:MAG: reverse transcriptase-like protein [Rhodocyclales bacterium]|nr:reverse transcriptase-like protein [Rhodocyclales bacterium]